MAWDPVCIVEILGNRHEHIVWGFFFCSPQFDLTGFSHQNVPLTFNRHMQILVLLNPLILPVARVLMNPTSMQLLGFLGMHEQKLKQAICRNIFYHKFKSSSYYFACIKQILWLLLVNIWRAMLIKLDARSSHFCSWFQIIQLRDKIIHPFTSRSERFPSANTL